MRTIKTNLTFNIGDAYVPVYEYIMKQAGINISSVTSDGKMSNVSVSIPLPERLYWDVRYHSMGLTSHERRDATFEEVTLKPYLSAGGKLLDFGCGLGRHTAWLSDFSDYYGADTSEYATSHAVSGHKYFPIKDKLPFQDGIFQTVFSCQVLKHILEDEDLKFWARELARVTAPHGIHVHYDVTWASTPTEEHVTLRPKEVIINIFRDAGIVLDADDYPYRDDLRTVLYGLRE